MNSKCSARKNRKVRIRKVVKGCSLRPRLTVFRSNKFIYAQLVDDSVGNTIVSMSSIGFQKGSGVDAAFSVGKALAEKAVARDVSSVVFDRNGYKFHGVVSAIAAGARDGGLKF